MLLTLALAVKASRCGPQTARTVSGPPGIE